MPTIAGTTCPKLANPLISRTISRDFDESQAADRCYPTAGPAVEAGSLRACAAGCAPGWPDRCAPAAC